jgi:hypothetical protein
VARRDGRVKIVYDDAGIKPENRDAVKLVRDSGTFERIADRTSKAVALPHCHSAWGFDADRRAKLLISQMLKGSHLGGYLQADAIHRTRQKVKKLGTDKGGFPRVTADRFVVGKKQRYITGRGDKI